VTVTADQATTYCTLIRITRTDAQVFGMTDLDIDLNVGGVDYVSASGYTPTNYQTDNSLGIGNADITGIFDASGIDKSDADAGLFDNAQIDIWIYDYVAATVLRQLAKGWWGEVKIYRSRYVAEFRSISQTLKNTVGRTFTATCDARFADLNGANRCTLDPASFTVTGALTAVSGNSSFTDTSRTEADNLYKYGVITWTSGNNTGRSMEVKSNTTLGAITLYQPMPFTVQVGDEYSMLQGCDKTQTVCDTAFSNIDNFRGFPDVPNPDVVYKIHGL